MPVQLRALRRELGAPLAVLGLTRPAFGPELLGARPELVLLRARVQHDFLPPQLQLLALQLPPSLLEAALRGLDRALLLAARRARGDRSGGWSGGWGGRRRLGRNGNCCWPRRPCRLGGRGCCRRFACSGRSRLERSGPRRGRGLVVPGVDREDGKSQAGCGEQRDPERSGEARRRS